MDHDPWTAILIRDIGRDPTNAVEDRHFLVDMVQRLHWTIDALSYEKAGD